MIEEAENRITKLATLSVVLFSVSDQETEALSKWRMLINLCANPLSRNIVLESLNKIFTYEKSILELKDVPFEIQEQLRIMLIEKITDSITIYMPIFVEGFKISFDEFTEMFFRIFSKETARNIVPLELIIKMYGAENAKKWNEL